MAPKSEMRGTLVGFLLIAACIGTVGYLLGLDEGVRSKPLVKVHEQNRLCPCKPCQTGDVREGRADRSN
jgi:hypothetical protein